MQFPRAAVTIAVAFAVGSLYLWIARAGNEPFHWKHTLGGYYNYLARGFAGGHLYVPIEPSPALLALPNPWDPKVDGALKVSDLVLFNRRYYLYHGVAPAVLLFLPWRMVTRHDVPENFALFLFCFGGFLFAAGALSGLLKLADATLSPTLWALMLVALGTCPCVPYLLNRVWVYEIAIGGAYFCTSAAIFFLVRAARSGFSPCWLAASGLFFGLAIGCRPHLGLAGLFALAGVAISTRRLARILAFVAPLVLVGFAVAAYNYVRFGNPLEFGVNYLLAGENQQRVKLAAEFVLPGLYYLLFCAPRFTPVFPWVLQIFRYPFGSAANPFPKEYFIEPTVGALYLAPFLLGILLIRKSGARMILVAVAAYSAAVLLFLAATGFTTQRYEPDFLAPAVLASLAAAGIYLARTKGRPRRAFLAAFTGAVVLGGIVSLALGVQGPYDGIFKNRPSTYVDLARSFSLFENYRPIRNPRVVVDFTAEFTAQPEELSDPLLTMGDRPFRYYLYVRQAGSRLRLISQCEESTASQEMDKPAGAAQFHVEYSPESRQLTVAVDGQPQLMHEIRTLLTAPSQVRVGENRIDPGIAAERFSGAIRVSKYSVSEVR